MASEGPLSPDVGADDAAVGTEPWTNPTLITASDVNYAVAGLDGATSHYLKATDFDFAIPTGATIDGIVVEIQRKSDKDNTQFIEDSAVRIVKGGTIGSTNKAAAGHWSTTEAYFTYGSSSDLWGETWTAADINGTTFGAVLSAVGTGPGGGFPTASVNHIRITVYYTEETTVESGPLSIDSTGSVTVASSEIVRISGALSVAATGSITITSSVLEHFVTSGQISVDATGSITVVSSEYERLASVSLSSAGSVTIARAAIDVLTAVGLSSTAAITIQSAAREVLSGALALNATASISIANAVADIVSGALSLSATASITIVSASIDDDILRVYLTATYQDRADGTAARGKVTFKLDEEIRDAIGNIIAARVRHKAHLQDGTFTIPLPVKTGGVDYVVVEEIVGADKRRYTITIPATPATTSLAEVS